MAGTVSVAVRSAVAAGLADVSELETFDVSYAWKPASVQRRQVFTLNARGDTPSASLRSGRNYRNETGTFEIVVHVEQPGQDQEATDTVCSAALTAVQEWVADRKNNELAVDGLNTFTEESWRMTGGVTDHSTVSQAFLTVRYTARLT